MKFLVVDDEELSIKSLVAALKKVEPDAMVITFRSPIQAFGYLSVNLVDVAFLDIEMNSCTGISLAKKCKDLCPTVNIVFVTGFSKYSMEAMKLHASGYLMKPVRVDDLRAELENLRYPLPPRLKRVRIQTFGNFEVFVDNKPLKVPRKKCNECLAYLVDRKGARVSYSQISAILWEGKVDDATAQRNTYKIISDLIKALKDVNAENILFKSHTDIAINIENVECDYFTVDRNNILWANAFNGEYMSNYSWAEFTIGELSEIKAREEKKGLIVT